MESKVVYKTSNILSSNEQFSAMLLELEMNKVKRHQFFLKCFTKNQDVYADFSVTKYVVFLKQGLCVVSEADLSKKRVVLEILGEQEFLGLGRLFGDSLNGNYKVTTKTYSEIIFIDKEYFLNYLSIRP
ncbi:cyclic nucleotide-binding domain-containing protein [Listeria sp. PSOL-1]|uniref:cyclic nucleotide-binding domain-containing protein n=1 Tax=Listeria sp. PSOL-1 TaxID=1844999 RepID=UPI0013D25906|nr:cyclic nucleotide-binding domain-containing protein [Listeria sp. PSOL-1]